MQIMTAQDKGLPLLRRHLPVQRDRRAPLRRHQDGLPADLQARRWVILNLDPGAVHR